MPCLPDIKDIFLPADTSGSKRTFLPPKVLFARVNFHFWTVCRRTMTWTTRTRNVTTQLSRQVWCIAEMLYALRRDFIRVRFGIWHRAVETDGTKSTPCDVGSSQTQQQVTNLMIAALKGLGDSSKLFRTPGKFRKPANVWKVKVLEPGRDFIINIAPLSRESAPAIVVAQASPLPSPPSLDLASNGLCNFARISTRALVNRFSEEQKTLPETMNQQPGGAERLRRYILTSLEFFAKRKVRDTAKLFAHLGSRRMSLAGRKPIDEPCFLFLSRMGKSVLRYGNRVESVDGDVVPENFPPRTWKRHKINSLSRAGIQLRMYFHKDSIESRYIDATETS